MVMFIVGKVWLFAVIAGMIFLFPRQSRFLAPHLLIGSTLGLLLAFVFSGVATLSFGSVASAGPVAMAAGGILGFIAGSWIAFKLNAALGQGPSPSERRWREAPDEGSEGPANPSPAASRRPLPEGEGFLRHKR